MARRADDVAASGCQVCGRLPVMIEDVLCTACAGTVQLSWRVAHARGAQRGEDVRWTGHRRSVETVALRTEAL
jgi:hypothetical protein